MACSWAKRSTSSDMIAMFGDCREGKLQATAYMHETEGHRSRMIGRDFATGVWRSESQDFFRDHSRKTEPDGQALVK